MNGINSGARAEHAVRESESGLALLIYFPLCFACVWLPKSECHWKNEQLWIPYWPAREKVGELMADKIDTGVGIMDVVEETEKAYGIKRQGDDIVMYFAKDYSMWKVGKLAPEESIWLPKWLAAKHKRLGQ